MDATDARDAPIRPTDPTRQRQHRDGGSQGIYVCDQCGVDIIFLDYVKANGQEGRMPCNLSDLAFAMRAEGVKFQWRMPGVVSHYDTCTAPEHVEFRRRLELKRRRRQMQRDATSGVTVMAGNTGGSNGRGR